MASKIRDRIVSNAVRSFAARGYYGSSTKEIAERANVTEGSLFRLCQSKDKLFTEALSVALSSKTIRKTHRRIVAFALLEEKGLTESNLTALRRFTRACPLIRELRSISK